MAIKNKRWTPRQAKFKVGTLVRHYGVQSSLGIIVELIGARRNFNYFESVYMVHWSVNPNGNRALPAAISSWAENLLIPIQEPA